MQLFIKVILSIFVVLLIALGWVIYATGHEVVSTVKTLNPQTGKSRALIIWHPGQSNFPERVMNAFAAGWMSQQISFSSSLLLLPLFRQTFIRGGCCSSLLACFASFCLLPNGGVCFTIRLANIMEQFCLWRLGLRCC